MQSVVSLLARGGGGRIISRDSPRLYRGSEGNNPASPLGTVAPNQCLAQAALTEGAQIMTACSTLALVIQVYAITRYVYVTYQASLFIQALAHSSRNYIWCKPPWAKAIQVDDMRGNLWVPLLFILF